MQPFVSTTVLAILVAKSNSILSTLTDVQSSATKDIDPGSGGFSGSCQFTELEMANTLREETQISALCAVGDGTTEWAFFDLSTLLACLHSS